MKTHFTRLTALLCAAAILLCSLPMQVLAAEFRPQTACEDAMPDELPAQEKAPAAPDEPELSEAAEQAEPAADASAETEAALEELAVSALSTGSESGDFTYSVLSDNTAQITGYSGTASSLTIPSELDGYAVCSIGSKAFNANASLIAVTFPEGLTSIGVYAFQNCTLLKEIRFPSTLTAIYGSAFYGCSSLSDVELPDSVTTLGASAFAKCTSLTKVNYPKSWNYVSSDDGKSWSRDINSINHYYSPFFGCAALKSIDVPDGVAKIPMFAFHEASIQSISIPESLTSIESRAFFRCSSLEAVSIPNAVTSISVSAFSGCTALKQVSFPSALTAIYGSAFYGCSALTKAELPDSITTLGASAFAKCTSLTKVNYPKSWNYVSSDDGKSWSRDINSINHYYSPFFGCAALKSIDVPDGVTRIPMFAFHEASIQSISLPESLTSIESRAFFRCRSLKAVSIPDAVTSISVSAFSGCTALKHVSFSSALTAIYGSAFYGCSALTKVELPDSITTLGADAFAKCTSLTKVNYPKSWNYVSSDDGKSWSRDINSINHYYSPCFGCSALESIDVPDGATRIPMFAFHYSSIVSIALPLTLCTIENYAFYRASSLRELWIPQDVSVIGDSAFNGIPDLTVSCNLVSNAIWCALENGYNIRPIFDSTKYLEQSSSILSYPQCSLNCVSASDQINSSMLCTLEYAINDEGFASAQKMQIQIQISPALSILERAGILLNDKQVSCSIDGRIITVDITEQNGTISFYAIPRSADPIICCSRILYQQGSAKKAGACRSLLF